MQHLCCSYKWHEQIFFLIISWGKRFWVMEMTHNLGSPGISRIAPRPASCAYISAIKWGSVLPPAPVSCFGLLFYRSPFVILGLLLYWYVHFYLFIFLICLICINLLILYVANCIFSMSLLFAVSVIILLDRNSEDDVKCIFFSPYWLCI
jgi:hypothetical protein